MPSSTAAAQRPTARPSPDQRIWIGARDRLGLAIDHFRHGDASPELITALRRLEVSMGLVDREVGLVPRPGVPR